MSTVIWSKDQCMFCDWAKELLESKGIEFEERNISHGPWTREQLQEAAPGSKTVPQIWLHGKYVGGFTELQTYIKNNPE